ncbi:ERAD-associated protein [Neurospora sp. IMI 360204]|nr:ERAD-associated protein [Neurospora sp. IMI 360204]
MSSHATPGPASKRRRVELANATLRRPFRSPMINRATSGDKSTPTATRQGKTTQVRAAVGSSGAADVGGGEEEEEDDDDDEETGFSSVRTSAARKTSKSSLHRSSGAGPSASTQRNAKPPLLGLNNKEEQQKGPRATSGINRRRSSIWSGSTADSNITSSRPPVGQSHTKRTVLGEAAPDGNDDILAGLQKSHREAKAHLSAMQKQLDLIRQAKRIEMASRKTVKEGSKEQRRQDATVIDAELKELVQKWKLASRQAAEELFELIKGRVAGMGGAKAWRETRRRQVEGFHSAWDDEGQKGKKRKGDADEREIEDSDVSDDGGLDDGDGQFSQGAGNNDDGEGSAEDDSEDSVRLLWQSLNIEPDVLGYDPNEDKWLD